MLNKYLLVFFNIFSLSVLVKFLGAKFHLRNRVTVEYRTTFHFYTVNSVYCVKQIPTSIDRNVCSYGVRVHSKFQ